MNANQNQPMPAPKNVAPKKRKQRRWLPYLGIIIVLGLIIAGLWPRPARVETARVTVGPLQFSVNEEGKTRIKEKFVISAPVSGQLRRITFKPGDDIQAENTVVAVIEAMNPVILDARRRASAEASRESAKSGLEKAETALEFAERELKRFQQLLADKAISVQEFEPIQWRAAAASRDRASAESLLKQAEAELMEFSGNPHQPSNGENQTAVEVRAPVSGKVLRLFEESSRTVSPGTPLMEIGNPADLEVVIDVLSRDGASISAGTAVELEQWGGGMPLQARVRKVEPAAFTKVSALGVEEQRVNVIADILTPAGQRASLGDQFRVEAKIITWQTNQALKVPSGALFRRDGKFAAYAVEDGRAVLRPVKEGKICGPETEVLEGLKDGDHVIVYPGDRIQPGQRVERIKISGGH